MLEHERRILGCPVGANPELFRYGDDGGLYYAEGVLYGQMVTNGLVRFVCAVDELEGPGWSYSVTCSPTGIRTIQPGAKGGSIYVDITSTGSDPTGTTYRGRIEARCDPGCAPRKVSFHVLGASEEPPLWTSTLEFAPDGLSFWFLDFEGKWVAMRITAYLEVLEIRRER
jgi:hypothetical protein